LERSTTGGGLDNAGVVSRVASPVFVGRRDQLELVREVLDRAVSGRPTFVVVAGDAGVGKTRFVDEVARRAEAGGWRTLAGGCVQMGDDTLPYAPIVEALRRLADAVGRADLEGLIGPGSAELGRLVPNLVPTSSTRSEAAEPSTGWSQGRLLEAILALLRHLAADRPLLLVVEDIHWADPSTLALLGYLGRNLGGAMVLVATYRSDELHRRHPLLPFVAELERRGSVERIGLLPFDRPEITELVRAIRVDTPQGLIDQLSERSDGNAFYIEELLATQAAIGTLPATLRDVLLARVATLTEPTQDLLRIAAAAGPHIATALLGTVSGLGESEVHAGLREAVERHILTLDATTDELAFRHALMREAIYEGLLPWERTRLHAAFALALEAVPATKADAARAAELAYHWHAAHDLPRALVAAVRAGAAFDGVSAPDEAHRQYERSLDLWDRVPDAAQVVGLEPLDLLERAAAAAANSDPGRAATLIRSAIPLVDAAADPVRAGELWERLATYLWGSGDGPAGVDAGRTALTLVTEDAPAASRARVLATLGRILMNIARFEEARPVLEEAVAVAASAGADATEGNALTSLGAVVGYLGDLESGRAKLAESRAIAIRLGSAEEVGRADGNLIDLLVHVGGRFDEAARLAGEAFTFLQESYAASSYGVLALGEGAGALIRLGRWEEADAMLGRARGYVSAGAPEILQNERLALLEVDRGHWDAAAERITLLRRLIGGSNDPQWTNPFVELSAELALWQRRPEDARDEIAGAFGRLGVPTAGDIRPRGVFDGGNVSRLGPVIALAIRAEADQVASVGGRPEATSGEIRRVTAGYLELMRAIDAENRRRRSSQVQLAGAWLRLCEAEAGRALGEPTSASWSEAARAFAGLEMPYQQAYARWREAEGHLATRGPRSHAVGALVEAHRLAIQLGAEPLLGEIEGVARRARVDLDRERQAAERPPKPDAAFGLTARELEVLDLLVAGLTNREIGDRLFISENTAGVHVSNILGKLGAARRMEAAAIAHRHGLLDARTPTDRPAP
jgi:DNA-binding CsgD family transcriptional regulator/tetratricopeptide (TPR) repeat protein